MRKIFTLLILYIVAGAWNAWGKRNDDTMASQLLYVTNPTFKDGINGWYGAPEVGGIGSYLNAQKKLTQDGQAFDVYQEVSGLPKGIYSLEVQAFYQGSTVGQSQLYAKVGDNEVKVNIMSIHADVHTGSNVLYNSEVGGGADAWSNEGKGYIPTCQQGASAYFNEGHYMQNIVWIFVENDYATLRVGIKNEGSVTGDWTCFDNFRLTYLGLYSTFTGSGTYYLQNVATGEYLQGGSSYGTKAILGNGIEFDIQYNGSCHTLSSGIIDNGNNNFQYLCTEASLDHIATPFAIQTVSEGIYTIATTTSGCSNKTVVAETPGKLLTATGSGGTVTFMSGKNSSEPLSQWRLVTKEQRIADLNNASLSNPVDATFLIGDASFTSGDKKISNWKGSSFNVARDWGTHTDGTAGIVNTSSATDVYQELTGLPNGVYEVSMEGCHKNGNNAQFYANHWTASLPVAGDDVTDIASASAKTYANDTYKQTLRVIVSDGKLKIGVRSGVPSDTKNNLLILDNFRLSYLGAVQLSATNPYTGPTATYYLQNVATGEYLQGGGFNGLQAMLGNGIEFELMRLADGLYNIRNVGINPDGNDYLCDEGRLDHQPVNFVITETSSGSGVYNIATQTQHCNNNAGFTTDDLSNRLLTAVAGSLVGGGYRNLRDFTFQRWTQAAPGGTYEANETYDNNIGNGNNIDAGGMVYGLGGVLPQSYADLSGYQSMFIKADPGAILRILINRNGINNGTDAEKGRTVEIVSTVGTDGYVLVDLSRYSHVHLNAIKLAWGSPAAKVESIVLAKQPAKTANLKDIQFLLWNQDAPGGTSSYTDRADAIGGAALEKGGTFFGDGSVTKLKYADLTGYTTMTIKGSPGALLQIRINRENDTDPYEGSTENVTIGSDGYAVVNLSKYKFVHLHSIKHAWGSPLTSASVESITLSRPDVVSFLNDPTNINQWDSRAQWRFVTEAQRIQELAGATRANPKNATFLIKNASLTEIDNEPNNVEASPFWKLAEHWYFIQRDGTVHTDGAGGIVNSKTSANDVYQELANLPNGLYEVSMQGCYRNFDNAVFYANGTSVSLDLAGSEFDNCNHSSCNCRMVASVQTYGTNNYKKTLRVVVTDGKLRIGVKGNKNADNNLLIYDNFTLSYLGEVEIKTYYMRNLATGDFIRAGGHYEAQAIRDEWGMPLDFIKKGDVYAIDSKVSNGGTNQFLGTNGFLDSPETDFTLVDLGNNKYAIRTADNKYLATSEADNYVNFDRGVTDAANDSHAQWELLTRDQLIAELKNSGASANNPKDATFLMEASNLNRHDLRNNSTWMGIDFGSGEYGGVESTNWDSRDNFANSAIEKFNKTFDTYQTISGLPAGVYELTVQGFYRSGNVAGAADMDKAGTDVLRPFLYAKQNDKIIGQTPLLSIFDADVKTSGVDGFSTNANGEYLPNSLADAARGFRDGYYTTDGEYNKVRFVVLWDYATVQIGVKKNVLYDSDWTAFDNFRLTYLGPTSEAQTTYDYEIGTTLGTFYLKNAETGTYLTAGGTDGVSAVLGDKMYEHSIYENETKYNQYTAGSLNGQLKGVRETDFTFVVVNAEGYSIQTGIGDGYLLRNRGPKVNGKLDGDKGVYILESSGNNTYRIKHSSGSYLRYTTATGTKDTEVLHDWDFTRTLTTNANFAADAANWRDANGDGSRWYYVPATTDSPLLIGGNELDDTQGLLFKGGAEKVRIYRDQYLRLDGMDIVVTIPGLKAGDQVTVVTNSPNAEKVAERYLKDPTNLTVVEGFHSMSSNEKWDNIATVTADGDVSFTTTGGINIYSIQVTREVAADGLGFENTTNPYVNGYNWVFQTKEELVAELDPTVASEDNPIDATFLLRGTAFHKDDSRNSAWTGKPVVGGAESNYVGSVSGRTFDISQKLTGVPNGVYEFTLQGYYITEGDALNTDVKYYTSTDGRTLTTTNYNGVPAVINGKNFTSDGQNSNDASTIFFNGQGTHPVIRFKVENNTIIAGVYNTIKTDNASLYIDNVRLTYLGKTANNVATPVKVPQGIIHKPSRFYELAEANGDLKLDKTTYNTTENNTTLSDKAMVAHDVLSGTLIQHTPVYRETIYAKAGQKLEVVLPSSYTNKNQSSNRYYQRIYNYATDDLFVENAETTGVFDFSNGSHHTDARIREVMRVYEGTTAHPAGGWLIGERWGQYLVSLFNYTTPTTFNTPIQIGLDHGDFTDVGDMGMFADLTEPTLSQRIVYTIQPAIVMVNKLDDCMGDVFLEEKSISFPTIWYGSRDDMNGNDRNVVALDLQLKNYFTDANKIPVSSDFQISLNDGGTGISLNTREFSGNTDRFIQFNYPAGGEVTNYKDKEAIITVTSGGKNIARFRLHFVPNTELRPWGDIMGQGQLRRSPTYLDEHAIEIDRLDFDNRYAYSYPSTWPVGTENTAINGVEEWRNVSSHDQFNPYPLDFDQTEFAANYFNAIWGQYSVMQSLRIPSYKDIRPFKDVNQLYHDYFVQEGTSSQQHKYPGSGYFMYIDASNFPSSIATLKLQEDLCEGTTIHFSGWVSSMDHSKNGDGTNNGNAPGYLLFSIVGIDANGNETVIESFCPGPIRADAIDYNGNKQLGSSYNAEVWDSGATSIWQQFAFSFVIKSEVANAYRTYALKIDNYCSHTTGGDMMVDDVRLYIQKAVPDIMQNAPICSTGDVANGSNRPTMEIYTTFEQLLNAVNMEEATDEATAYASYTNKSAGGKIIPSGWYCFLDKKKYDAGIAALAGKTPSPTDFDKVFNDALITSGGNGNGYYQFDFSTCFKSNDGGKTSHTNTVDDVTYMAKGEEITNESGTERRIYLNLEDCAVSLKDLPYYENSKLSELSETVKIGDLSAYNDWVETTPDWNMGVNGETIYGTYMGEQVHYVDLEGYDELRVYQTEGAPVRCFFFNTSGEITKDNVGSNLTVSSEITTDRPIKYSKVEYGKNGEYYWSVDLNEVKANVGAVKLIAVKSNAYNSTATVTAINAVRKGAVLAPNKDYYIVFRAYKGETGETSVGGPTAFFNLNNAKCAAMASFSLVSGTELRYDGGLDSEGVSYCEGQIATVKMEIQAINTAAGVPVKEEDLFYDWWLGDINSFSTKADDKPDSPQGVLFDFREAYPDATVYDGQPAKVVTLADGGYECNFTEADRTYLEELVEAGTFLLYQSSLNMKITNSSGYQAVSVMPIVNLLEKLTGLPYCKGPIEVKIPVQGKSPSAKHGFQGTNYPMDEVPVRIGLSQLKSATDESADKWIYDNTSSLYIPLRNIAFSDESKYNSFGKKKHNWGTGSTNTLEIAAVYLAETNDPDMVSYGDDVDPAGNRELRYVGKMHKFEASKGNTDRFKDYVQLTFNPDFTNNVKEGYRYTLKTSFEESGTTTSSDGTTTTTETNTGCAGDLLIPLYIVPEYQVWIGGADGNWANDDNWRRADNPELKLAAGDSRPTNEQNTTASGFVPMDFTHVLMKTDSTVVLEFVTKKTDDTELVEFPANSQLGEATPDIQYHLAAKVKKPPFSWFPQERTTDIYCEPFYTNTAKEVHFEPHSQMLNTQYLTYERAWVEYALESGRWYTLSSPLQGVVSGDMYLPRGTAKQETPYFDPITYNNTDYTRLAPAVYQQAWDKAEATTYRLERDELVNKLPPQLESNTATVNVARAFDWSREYNDVKVPFGINGFSVKVDVSRIKDYTKGNNERDVLLRLPKDDKTYLYYMYDDEHNGSQTVDLTTTVVNGKNLRENAGKLFTDGMPAGSMTVTLTNNSADNPYFLVGNPFMSGLNLDKFFEKNGGLENECWILTGDSYSASIKTGEQWASTDEVTTGNVAPLQAFFVKKSDGKGGTLNVTFTSEMVVQLTGDALQTRAGGAPATLRLTAMRDGVESRAIVVCREEATEGFSAGEDVEALFDSNLSHAPTLYTAAGEVAAAINVRRTLHGVPVGIGGEDESEVTLTFDGVEQFGEELYLYDAAEGTSTLIPASGTSLSVCGRTTGRYYLVTTPLDGSAQESVPVVSVQGHVVTVLSAFDEILSVEAYDATGRKVYAEGAVGNRTRFTLSAPGVYLITVKTAAGVFSHKVLVNS